MKRWHRSCLVALAMLIANACYFEPEGTYFENLVLPDLTEVSIDLGDVGDTLFLSKQTHITYTSDTQDFFVNGAIALIDSTIIYENYGTASAGSFNIDPTKFTNGYHTFKMILVIYEGTKSLAEKLGAERTMVWRELVAVIDTTPPNPPIISFSLIEGKLVVRWPAYAKWSFENYEIEKYCTKDDYYYSICQVSTIHDQDSSFWIDENFVGGSVKYRIGTTAAGKTIFSCLTPYNWEPRTSFTTSGTMATLHWEKPRFYAATTSVILHRSYFDQEEILPEDTVRQVTDLQLGFYYDYPQVTLVSANPNTSFTFSVPNYLGEWHELSTNKPLLYSTKHNLYYGFELFNRGTWRIIDGELNPIGYFYNQGSIVRRSVSIDGEWFVAYVSGNGQNYISEVDPFTLEPMNVYTFGDNVLTTDVATNGFIAYSTSQRVRVVALPDYHEVYIHDEGNKRITLSSSGEYLLEDTTLFQYDGNNFVEAGSVSIYTAATFSQQDRLILCHASGLVEFLDTPNLSLFKTVDTGIVNIAGIIYDYSTDLSLVNSANVYKLIGPQGEGVTVIPVGRPPLSMMNGKLFVSLSQYAFSAIDSDYFQ